MLDILQDWRVASHLGNGDTWDEPRVLEAIHRWKTFWLCPEGERECLTWILSYEGVVAAVVQIRKQEETRASGLLSGAWFVVVATARAWQGRGIGSCATEVCCRTFQSMPEGRDRRVLAVCSETNSASEKCLEYAQFVPRNIKVRIGGSQLQCKIFVLEPPPRSGQKGAKPVAGTAGSTTRREACKTPGGAARGGASRTRSSAPRDPGSSRR